MDRLSTPLCTVVLILFSTDALAQGSNVVVHLRDSTIVESELIAVGDSTLTLAGALVQAPELGKAAAVLQRRFIPFHDVESVVVPVEEPRHPSGIVTFLAVTTGFTLGFVLGEYLGVELAGPSRILITGTQMKLIPWAEVIAIVVGILGGWAGYGVVNQSYTQMTAFHPNIIVEREALRLYAREK